MIWTEHTYYWETTGFTIAKTGRKGREVFLLWDLRANKRGDLVEVRRCKTEAESRAGVAELMGLASEAAVHGKPPQGPERAEHS